jgi:hypothetical protein
MTLLGGFTGNVRDALTYLDVAAPSSPSTFYRANLPRVGNYDSASDTGNVALTTQVMTSVPIKLFAGDVITNISFVSGATAAGTPTNWWCADQTSTAWAAATVMTKALSAAQTISTTGIYWAAIMVKATTPPTLMGCVALKPIVTGERNLAQTSGAALTTTAPATIATPTVANFAPYVVLT